MAGALILAGLLALVSTGSTPVASQSKAPKAQPKFVVQPANLPSPQLEPLRPAEPTPAQRAMPGSY